MVPGLRRIHRVSRHGMGLPVRDDRRLFEKITPRGIPEWLSWLTILRKRENFRRAFAGFDFEKVARFTPARRAAAPERRDHPPSRQDREHYQQRETMPRARRRVQFAGGFRLGFRVGSRIAPEKADDYPGVDGDYQRVHRAVERVEEARLDVRRADHHVCVHAGDGAMKNDHLMAVRFAPDFRLNAEATGPLRGFRLQPEGSASSADTLAGDAQAASPIVLLVLVLLTLGVYVAARQVLGSDLVRSTLEQQLSAALNQPVHIASASAAIYPRVAIKLGNVTIGDPVAVQVREIRIATGLRPLCPASSTMRKWW